MRPCFAKRRTMPSSIFLSSFFFVRLESLSANFSMKLAVSFAIRGVVEFPIDARRPSDLEVSIFPLGLVITCLYEHRSTGYKLSHVLGSLQTRRRGLRHRATVHPRRLSWRAFTYRRSGFSRLHTHQCEIRTISCVCKCHYRHNWHKCPK